MFAKFQLKAVGPDLGCFGIVSVNSGIKQIENNSHILEQCY